MHRIWVASTALCFGCAAGPSLSLATSGPTTLHTTPVRQGSGESAAPTREIYDRWGTRWCFDSGAPLAGTPAVGRGGQIYVGTTEGYLHALDRSGGFLWSYTVKGAVHVPPVVLPSGAVVVATRQNLIYAIRPNGRRLWVYRAPEPIQTPIVVSDKGTLVFGAGRFYAYAVSPLGGLVWRVKMPAPLTEAVRLHKNGTVFMGTQQGVVTFQAPTRQQVWQSPPVESFVLGEASSDVGPIWLASGRAFSSHGPMQLSDGLRFGRTLPERALLLSTRSELRWVGPTGAMVRTVGLDAEPSATPLVGANGEVWVPSVDGTLFGVDPDATEARAVARIGYSPLFPLVSQGPEQLVAATGEGNVCGVSRTRMSP